MKLFYLVIVAAVSAFALGADVPTQVHVAVAGSDAQGNSNGFAVSWNTKNQTSTSIVKYGTSSGVYIGSASGVSSAYYETFNHHVVLSSLSPSTKYFYIVGDDAQGWSKEFSFTSAPLSSEMRENFSFLVYGDLGVVNGDPTKDYIESVKDDIELIWHAGDASYADDSFLHKGCVTKFCYEDTLDEYMSGIEEWASQVPYMVTPGNHEADCHDPACLTDATRREKLSNFTAYNNRFRMPSPESGGVLNMHYSFNYGSVHFISIDAETGYPGAAEETKYVLPCGGFGDQLTWLENDLILANRQRDQRPWILAAGHHPMYQGNSINADFQAAMEDLFYKYGVDVYFSGHVHSYERDLPVYKGVPEPDYVDAVATTHLLIGGAGNDEMKNIQIDRTNDPAPQEGPGKSKWFESDDNGPWTAVTDGDNHVGIGKVTIVDDSTLKFEYIRTTTGEVFDSMTLTRDHSKYFTGKK